ncbi:hypothetical protein E4T66_17740 [Sinimarinibacterium sp. CAU 1509]|uniref:hypothetical protein n=1 Tax=Sinimarinibacterium sp. CAU 1509 TaxID=2562283 RepID=UPI0010AC9998|nr:hypothetical protein [Sinimarinibacterium sp. CAU 1509]TJY57250.1 hypothetical protein E4T66_17740 [Sinimarinibacterium sp. CAU 1509]
MQLIAYLYPTLWQLFTLSFALAVGSAGWLLTYRHHTALHWLAASIVVAIATLAYGFTAAPADVVVGVVGTATRMSCDPALAALHVDDSGQAYGSLFDVASARRHLLLCAQGRADS